MKRVKAACIMQTLVFSQKDSAFLSRDAILDANRREIGRYLAGMDHSHTRYQVISQETQEDGSIELRIRKQYNDKADVCEYFR